MQSLKQLNMWPKKINFAKFTFNGNSDITFPKYVKSPSETSLTPLHVNARPPI